MGLEDRWEHIADYEKELDMIDKTKALGGIWYQKVLEGKKKISFKVIVVDPKKVLEETYGIREKKGVIRDVEPLPVVDLANKKVIGVGKLKAIEGTTEVMVVAKTDKEIADYEKSVKKESKSNRVKKESKKDK